MNRSPFRFAHSGHGQWMEAAEACLRGLQPVPVAANLGFVYVTDLYANRLPDIVDYLRVHSGVAHWVGSVGIGVCATAQEYLDESAIAVMLGEFPEDGFRVFGNVTEFAQLDEQAGGFEVGGHAAHYALVHGDARNAEVPEIIEALAARMQSGFVTGGITSSRFQSQQVADDVVHGGLSGVMFGAQVPVMTRLTQGVTPIAAPHQVTASQENILISLDGRPALDVLNEDVGEILARDLSRAAGYIFAALTVSGSDTRDYLVRNLIGADTNERLVAISEVVPAQGDVVFCRRDASAAREDMLRMLGEIKLALSAPPRGAVYYSCLGRGEGLFGADSVELKLISEVLGEFPLVGFFANGEISHDRLYGYTGVLTLFL
ncbi:MAG: FIST N-terminal domain-containing protein [Pseudomonadota bacterium]